MMKHNRITRIGERLRAHRWKIAAPFTLRHEGSWVELRPLSAVVAQVVQGTGFLSGQYVECPSSLTWAEAAEMTHEGNSVLEPWRLRLVRETPSTFVPKSLKPESPYADGYVRDLHVMLRKTETNPGNPRAKVV